MSERYTRLFSLPENLYSVGAPVVIAAGALLKDNQTGKVLAQLKIQNISDKAVKAATVSIAPLDTVGKPLGEAVSYQYLDLNAGRDAEFGQKTPVALPDAATRAFSASVSEVIFTDDTAWSTSEIPWTPIFVNLSLEQALQDRELIKQFKIRYNEDSKYIFKKEQDLWLCVCGKINHQNEERCHKCRRWASVLAAVDLDELKASKEKRLEIAKQKAAEEKAAAEVKAKKVKKLAMIAVPIAVIAIIMGVLISENIQKNTTYNSALSFLEAGEYSRAIAIFEGLGDYKDSPSQIEEAERQQEEAAYQSYVSLLVDLIRYSDSRDELFDNMIGSGIGGEEEFNNFIRSNVISESQKEGKYQVAVALSQNLYYEEAVEIFDSLGDYSDSAEQKEKIQAIMDEQLYTEAVSEYPTSPVPLEYWSTLLEKFSQISPDYQNTAQYVEELASVIQTISTMNGTYYGSTYTIDGETHTSYFTISGSECETDKPVLDDFSTPWDITDEPLAWGIEDDMIYGVVTLCNGWGGHVIKKIVPTGSNSILVIDDTSRAGETYQPGSKYYKGRYSTYDGVEETYTRG